MKRKRNRQTASEWASGGMMDTSMFWFGDMNAWGTMPSIPEVYQKPRPAIFSVTRLWVERLTFVNKILELKAAIYSHNFSVSARDPKKKSDVKLVEGWFQENEYNARRFNRDAWQEWLIQRNVVSLWRKGGAPVIYPLEHCSYDDTLGIEQLAFTHGIPAAVVETMPGLKADERKELRVSETIRITRDGQFNSSKVFFFRVVKRTRLGNGLAWPTLRSIFNTVQTWDALEVADWQLSDAMRTVYELHKLGHEIKNGPHAGSNAHFLKNTRAAAVRKLIKNDKRLVARVLQLLVNFDHEIEYPRPDPKHFGKNRYESALQNLLFWAMPLGQMVMAQSVNPFLMPLLKAQTYAEREYMRPFVEAVLRESLKMPAEAVVTYGDDCLWDSQTLLAILKTGLASGPMSQETFNTKTGLVNPGEERGRKESEASLGEGILHPAYDAAHGPPKGEDGHPPGKANTAGRGK